MVQEKSLGGVPAKNPKDQMKSLARDNNPELDAPASFKIQTYYNLQLQLTKPHPIQFAPGSAVYASHIWSAAFWAAASRILDFSQWGFTRSHVRYLPPVRTCVLPSFLPLFVYHNGWGCCCPSFYRPTQGTRWRIGMGMYTSLLLLIT